MRIDYQAHGRGGADSERECTDLEERQDVSLNYLKTDNKRLNINKRE